MPFQVQTVNRFTKRCRKQHGGLLIHSMGSGKTRTAIALAMNLPYQKMKFVITPPALDTPWKDEALKNFNLPVSALDNVRFMDYNQLKRVDDENIFANAIILCDEAHWLLDILRYSDNEDIIKRGFKRADKVYLLTGTPLQNDWNDLSALVNLAAAKEVLPGNMPDFNDAYAKTPALYRHLLDVSNYIVFPALTAYAASNLYAAGKEDAAAIQTTGLKAAASMAYLVGYSALGVISRYRMRNLARSVVEGYDSSFPTPVNTEKLFEAVKQYVSYFDFNNLVGDELKPYPVQVYREEKIPLTPFQLEMATLWAYGFQEDKSTLREHGLKHTVTRAEMMVMFGQRKAGDYTGTTEKAQRDADEFRKDMRRLGNITWDHFYLSPVRLTMEDKPEADRKGMDIYNCGFGYVARPAVPDDVLPPQYVFPGARFACPKFVEALHIIEDVRTKSTFLPVVYSNFDELGFQSFSAFLNSVSINHIVIHARDSAEVRQRLVGRANEPYARLKPADSASEAPEDVRRRDDAMLRRTIEKWGEKFKLTPADVASLLRFKSAQATVPYCVLVHPIIKEGISFTLNPAMIILEAPDGYGNQEQIYARVLRTLKPIDREIAGINGMLNADGRVCKDIVQVITSDGQWKIEDGLLYKTNKMPVRSRISSAFGALQRLAPKIMPSSMTLPYARFGAVRPDSRFAMDLEQYSTKSPAAPWPKVFPGWISRFVERYREYIAHETSEDFEQSNQRVGDLVSSVSMDERTKQKSKRQQEAMFKLGAKLKDLSDDTVACARPEDTTDTVCDSVKCSTNYGNCHLQDDTAFSGAGGMGGAVIRRRRSRSKARKDATTRRKSKTRSKSKSPRAKPIRRRKH